MNKRDFPSEEYNDLSDKDWHLSRKKFMQLLLLSGVAAQLPWLQSCSVDEETIGDTSPLSLEQFKVVREVQQILFPDDGNGPGAKQINADNYLLWVLRDPLADANETNYIIKRIDQFISTCKKEMGSDFLSLSATNQFQFVKFVASEGWGDKWFSRLIIHILEALLLDPVYGGNTNKTGWEWLEHNPGLPRPTAKLIYPEILKFHAV
ncbi:MAG: gluconate 2-dehydrogenase subunit 3 family protein [Flavobacteriales bacterium]